MPILAIAFLIVAVILFVLTGLGIGSGRYSLLAFGLAAWAFAEVLRSGLL